MNITWLTVNSSYSHSSLALPLVHAACSEIAAEWKHVQVTVKEETADIARCIFDTSPELICAPLYIFNRTVTIEVLSRVKALLPDVIIAVGGPECLAEAGKKVLDEAPFIDYVCHGEGEAVLPALISAIQNDSNMLPPGVLARDCDAEAAPLYRDWETAAPPCQDVFFDASKPFVQIETARGCPNSCIFCTSARTKVRRRSLVDVRSELAMLQSSGIREIRVLDRTFNMPSSRAASLLKMFREEYPQIRFHLEVHPSFLTEEIRSELKKTISGKLHIEAGIQTLQPDVLSAIGRADTADSALEGLSFLCAQPNLITHTDLLCGCPCQTFAGLLEDLRTLVSVGPDEIQLEVLKVLPGTPLARKAKELGIRFSPMVPYDVMATPTMSIHDIWKARCLSRMIDQFYNVSSLRPAFSLFCTAESSAMNISSFAEFLEQKSMLSGGAQHLMKRFQALDAFAVEYPMVRNALAVGWLTEAFPVGSGPASESAYVHSLPENAILSPEQTKLLEMPNTRIVRLQTIDKAHFFIYNRSIAPNHAVFQLEMV